MPDGPSHFFIVDMGTTRTRVWLTQEHNVAISCSADFGVRNVAAGQTRAWLSAQLQQLLSGALSEAKVAGVTTFPSAIIASGMITSAEGLREVPHLQAPAGALDLARHVHRESFTVDGCDIPFLLVPGVRTGTLSQNIDSALSMDMMRGEEALCIGLLDSEALAPDTVLLNLGSHWKWIWTDDERRIARSHTTLTGEMIHAIQAHTLIAAALPQHPPQSLDSEWLHRGFTEATRSGLSRALFCVRLLAHQQQGTPETRLSFLYGAFLQTEIAALRTKLGNHTHTLLIAGATVLSRAWQQYAQDIGVPATVLTEAEREQAYLRGLRSIYQLSGTL